MHRPNSFEILRDDGLCRAAPVNDVALQAANETHIGISVDIEF